MPVMTFIEKTFQKKSLQIIETANDIIAEYEELGFTLTLRQLYYQFVARDLIPNRQTEYKRLGSIINDARLAGLIDWDAIEDRTRNLQYYSTWNSPSHRINSAANSFAIDLWEDQTFRPEVWIEKDALAGVIEPVCERYQVPYFACRGYSSQSEQWRAGQRFEDWANMGYSPIVFHLGDHDPSGIDMTRDNQDRLNMFSFDNITVERLALNFDQVKKYKPPPNPAKDTDSRSGDYKLKFGNKSWELDALDPRVIDNLIETAILAVLDMDKFEARQRLQEEQRKLLQLAAKRWDSVVLGLEPYLDDDEED